MNAQHFWTVVWLRWRLRVNQLRRGGVANFVILCVLAAFAVLVAVGKPHFLSADMVKPGAAVIDIGINQITDASGQTRIVGDVDTDAVKEVASWVTPVPGGVGPVTVAMFMRNAIAAHAKQVAAGWI